MVSTAVAASFHTAFQASKAEIEAGLSSSSPDTSTLSRSIVALRRQLDDARASLPTYDQRSYDLQLRDLESKLAKLRATSDRPKSKFAFTARRAPQPTPRDAPPASTLDPPAASSSSSSSSSTALTSHHAGPSTSHVLANRSGEHLTLSSISPSCPDGTSYTLALSDLSDSIVDLRPAPRSKAGGSGAASEAGSSGLTALHANGLHRCVLIGPEDGVAGSAMLSNLTDCIVILSAQQFRIHSSSSSTFLLHPLSTSSTPIIEHSSSLTFGDRPPDHLLAITLSPRPTGEEGALSRKDRNDDGKAQYEVQDFDNPSGRKPGNWRWIDNTEREQLSARLRAGLYGHGNPREAVNSILGQSGKRS